MVRMRMAAAALLAAASLSLPVRGAAREPAPRAFRESSYPSRQRYAAPRSQAERLRRIMIPLLQAADHPVALDAVRVQIVNDPSINAGSAGNGRFVVTTGLLQRASDDHLRGVLAHEIAHDDLGHAARTQMIGTGVGLGMLLLEQLFPGSGAVAPLAGALITRSYSRPQEYEADRHAIEILRRAGHPKEVMVDTLAWLMELDGDTGGGILSTHPATSERIRALRSVR
ncbi:MAG TPA: M48 family metallopeptidase [candidate division Zixibacteria bacterium]|nr:M48 family metallopeptidase [candidate division Zixibacteria bacterium]